MKIAMIGQKGVSSRAGGIEIHVEEIGKRLAGMGHEVYIYTRPHYTDVSLKEYKGMKLIPLPTINSKHLDAITHTFISSVHSLFKEFDIIHYHAIGPSTMSFIPRIFARKVVCTIHGLDWKREKWGKFAKMYLKLGEIAACKIPHETIVVSNTLKKYLYDKYKRDSQFIPNGVNTPLKKEPEIIKNKYGLQKDGYILFLARLVPEKGVHYLLQAYNKILTNKKLVIAGGSSHSSDYEQKLKSLAGNNKNIIFTGHVQGQELSELFTNAYVYVLPSEIEGLPISLLEALSYGQCSIVSNIDENLEVIEDKGFTFENKNYVNLSQILSFLVNNPDEVYKKRKLVEEYVLTKYNWDSISKQTEQLYMKILKEVF
ncbi:MAG: hypothetical protein JG776_2351 [Caloramator sp.]|jgi:glycosyltransferase involved in cell wall biosynthesis|uniref:glycosyltransferase family 4 protein n=1 Tax=Eubacteriales TaxID=186802 RepID=UPI000B99CA3D|nr:MULTISPECIES: glycosyltransferase family 4 protein [Eubacteriales]MBZ4664627.1 hypothetical protein [Caloramator sp.]